MNTELTAIAVEDQRQDTRDHSNMEEQAHAVLRGVGIRIGGLTEGLEKTGEEAQISHRAVSSL
jgi:hypothetical protein